MKLYIFTLSAIIFFTYDSYSQYNSGKIIYIGTLDLTDKIATINNVPKKFRNKMLETYKNIRPVTFSMVFNKNESLLKKNEALQLDGAGINLAYYQDSDKERYSNTKQNIRLRHKEARGNDYLIHDSFDTWQWNISNQSKKIGKYTCYKATVNIKQATQKGIKNTTVHAWFSPEIPFSFGPHSFDGLPGMILELSINNFTYKAKKITINKHDLIIIPPNKGEKISQEDFLLLEKSIWEGIKSMRN